VACAHGNRFFLPWRRAYLYYFEEIWLEYYFEEIWLELSGDDTFALPYCRGSH
jgi:hypothetical protein